MTGFAMPRVFAALLLPHDVCDALARDAKAFARIDPLARFTRSTNLHLTLAFVGEISTIDARRLSAALRPLCALTPRDITIGRIGTFDRQRILYAGLSPAESLDPVVNEVRSTITRLGLPLDDKPFRAHITLARDSLKVSARDIDGTRFYYGVNADWQLARDWRRGHPPMTLPARTVPLSGPVLMETVKDPRTGMIRYRQVL
jgi:2'-5' RNA ligase